MNLKLTCNILKFNNEWVNGFNSKYRVWTVVPQFWPCYMSGLLVLLQSMASIMTLSRFNFLLSVSSCESSAGCALNKKYKGLPLSTRWIKWNTTGEINQCKIHIKFTRVTGKNSGWQILRMNELKNVFKTFCMCNTDAD